MYEDQRILTVIAENLGRIADVLERLEQQIPADEERPTVAETQLTTSSVIDPRD